MLPNVLMKSLSDLPDLILRQIFEYLLIVGHPLYLFRGNGDSVEVFAPDKPRQWLALLYTSWQMNEEASAVVYGCNTYNLLDATRDQSNLLRSFLNCIGPANANKLSRICTDFPVIEGVSGAYKLRSGDLQVMKLLQEKCKSIKVLETCIHSGNSKGLSETDQESSPYSREALTQFDIELKAIASLRKLIVTVYTGKPSPSASQIMRDFGWVVRPAHAYG